MYSLGDPLPFKVFRVNALNFEGYGIESHSIKYIQETPNILQAVVVSESLQTFLKLAHLLGVVIRDVCLQLRIM